MAPIALKEKDRCQGFSKDHRQCRLRHSKGLTCNIHQKYLVNWFLTHPSAIWTHRSSREIYEYEYVLKNRLVTIPEDHMDFLENSWIDVRHYSEYLTFIAKYSEYDLLRIPRSLRYLVNRWCDDLLNHIQVDTRVQPLLDKIGSFLTNHKVCFELLNYIIESLMNHYLRTYDIPFMKERFSCIMYMIPQWKQILHSNELLNLRENFVKKFGPLSILKEEFFTEVVDNVIIEFNNCHRFAIYYSIYKVKKDLLEEVLHPDRIMKLIEMHGMDILDHI